MKVDYHMHTSCSDGSLSVERVVDNVLAHQLVSFAISDHDTMDGVERARTYCGSAARFISGIELTCAQISLPSSKIPFSIHLLGYGFDTSSQPLRQLLETRACNVENTYICLCAEISALGFPILVSDIPIRCGIVLQLSDVQTFLMRKFGDVPIEVLMLIDQYRDRLDHVNLTIEEGIHYLQKAGAKTVWAHPFHVYHRFEKIQIDHEEVEHILHYLIDLGLDGIEAYYAGFDQEQQRRLSHLAQQYGLICTAGSDFHGSVGRDHMGMEVEKDCFDD